MLESHTLRDTCWKACAVVWSRNDFMIPSYDQQRTRWTMKNNDCFTLHVFCSFSVDLLRDPYHNGATSVTK